MKMTHMMRVWMRRVGCLMKYDGEESESGKIKVKTTHMMRVWMRRVGCLMMSRKLPPAAAALGFVRTICKNIMV